MQLDFLKAVKGFLFIRVQIELNNVVNNQNEEQKKGRGCGLVLYHCIDEDDFYKYQQCLSEENKEFKKRDLFSIGVVEKAQGPQC